MFKLLALLVLIPPLPPFVEYRGVYGRQLKHPIIIFTIYLNNKIKTNMSQSNFKDVTQFRTAI